MPDVLLFGLAVLVNIAGLGWLALAMDVHWEQALGPVPASGATIKLLRVLGVAGLVASLLLCLSVDHASMASLVWFMTLAGAALAIAFTLTWRAHWLGLLVGKLRSAA
ncbi:DUF3325 domain-containing protein [Variovorax sp. HJSM1_2]|uniref:DUF3325 domain-containing protein n=1 Tax=Variovorax sp. HJSM1_2 TaxID=3366263 RepID=UPI003BE59F25